MPADSMTSFVEVVDLRGREAKALPPELAGIPVPACARNSNQQRTYIIDGEVAFKIGRANNPATRMRDMQSGSPLQLRLLAIGCVDVEQALHGMFHQHRSHGEWFSNGGRAQLASLLYRAKTLHGGCIACAALYRGRPHSLKAQFLDRFKSVRWEQIECSNDNHWNCIGWVDRFGDVEWCTVRDGPNLVTTARSACDQDLTAEDVWSGTANGARRDRVPGISLPLGECYPWRNERLLSDSEEVLRYLEAVHTVRFWRPGCVACACDLGMVTSPSALSWHRRWSRRWKSEAA